MTEIERQIENKFIEVEQLQMKEYPLLRGCIRDGVLYPDLYEKSPLKIMVILKEPYDEWDGNTETPVGGDFAFLDVINNLETHYLECLNRTWIKLAALGFALKNGVEYSENLSYEQVKEGLSCVCVINLSKTPWKTTTKMDEAFFERVKIWGPVVRAQLAECNPDIVFYGNTWDASWVNPIEPDLEWEGENCTNTRKYCYKSKGGNKYTIYISQYKKTGKLLVNGYHPEFGNSSCWQTSFIQNYMNRYGL